MAHDITTTMWAIREAADLALEHLVQQHGISPPDIFIQSATDRKTADSVPSGGDASHEEGPRKDVALEGDIEISADIAASQITAVQRRLGDAGAIRVLGR